MGGKQRSKPSFFKVLSNEGFTRQLRLPIVFVQKYGEILAENTILRASSGESWVVKLEHIEDDKYFTSGWSKFAEDLGLRKGEFLVSCEIHIDVSVYGISGCERVISNCKSEFGSSYSDKEVETLSIFTEHSHRDVSNKRVKTSSLEKDAGRSPLNVDRSSPLYFEIVLNSHHVSRVPLGMKFAKISGLISQNRVLLEYVPKQHFTSAAVVLRPRSRIDLAWQGFAKENQLVYGRTYSIEFNPKKNVIQGDETKKKMAPSGMVFE